MMEFTIYDTATGEIVRALRISDPEDLPDNIGPGQDWIEGAWDKRAYRVEGRQPVERAAAPRDLEAERQRALAELDGIARVIEQAEIDNGGRALAYIRAEQEAKALLAYLDTDEALITPPDPAHYPLVAADIAAGDVATLEEAATNILTASARLTELAAAVKAWRRTRKIALVAAATVGEIDAVRAEMTLASLEAALAPGPT